MTDRQNPAAAVEVREPCPYCGDQRMIPRRQFADHVARLHPGVREGGPGATPAPADLRQRIAEKLREHGMVHLGDQVPADEYDCCADAVLAVVQPAIAELAQAIRLTREYVGEELLPPIEGWSWYDALRRWAPHELQPPAPAHDAGPSVAECAEADRHWPLEKEGL